MAKRRLRNPKAAIKRWEKQGRSQGSGSDYSPWTHIQDKRTGGMVTRILGWKTNRLHHFFGGLELAYFYYLEWADEVIDIREHRRLLSDETVKIAQMYGLKHPTYPKSDVPVEMTTDFFITLATPTGSVARARAVVASAHIKPSRLQPSLEIEKRYWQSNGVEWSIVTEMDVPRVLARNVALLHTYRQIGDRISLSAEQVDDIALTLTREAVLGKLPLRRLTSRFDDLCALPLGTCLAIVYHLLATKQWTIDMNAPIDPGKAIQLVSWEARLEP